MSVEFDKKFKDFNQWYQYHHYSNHPDRDVKQQVAFLTDAMDEAIFLLAHACKSIRCLEGREGTGLILPASTAAHKRTQYG